MTTKVLLLLISAISLLPAHAQKLKLDREKIFLDKKEKAHYECPYKKMLPTDTYAYLWKEGQLPFEASVGFAGTSSGRLVGVNKNPDYIFEYVSSFTEPKIEYIKTSTILSSQQELGYVARIIYKNTFSVKILNKQKELLKTIIISDGSCPEVYYFCSYTEQPNTQGEPRTLEANEVNADKVKGWLTAELLALKMTENMKQIKNTITTKILEKNFRKGRSEIHFLMCDGTYSPFRMYLIKEKSQKDFPQLTEELTELRNCFIQWARTPEDTENLQKLASFATKFEQKGNETEDRNTRLLYRMNAALAYIMCKDYNHAITVGHEGMVDERGVQSFVSLTLLDLYHTIKKIEAVKQSSDIIDATISYNLEEDYKKLQK
ncbi:hypothetical protein [Bacteroides sp.]